MYCENFHTSRHWLPRTNRFREPSSENIANFNTTPTDWSQEAPGKVWEKTSENMFSTPFVYSLVKNHWLQRQLTDAVTSWTNSPTWKKVLGIHIPHTHTRLITRDWRAGFREHFEFFVITITKMCNLSIQCVIFIF